MSIRTQANLNAIPSPFPPRRTLNRLASALLALALGGAAQAAFGRHSLWDGLALYAVAAVLFARAVGRAGPGRTRKRVVAPPELSGGVRQVAGGWLVFGALLFSLAGQRAFAAPDAQAQAWWLYGGSLLLFVAGVLLFTGPEKPPPGLARRLTSPPAVALLCILLLAFGLRLWQFNSLPFGVWYDEAEAGLQARRWLADPFYKPPFYAPINVSGQFLLLYSLALRTISDTVQGLRVVSVLFGVAGAAAAYLFGRRLNGPLFGLSLAFFLAVMRWDINFSRIAMTGIDAPFFEFISLYYLLKLRQEGRLRDAAFVGLGLGLGLSFYTAFRLFALTAALFAVGWGAARLWRRRGTGRAWWGRVAAAGGMLLLGVWVALMPVAQHALRRPDSYWSRVRTTSIVTRRDDPNLARALRNSLGKHLAMFHLAGDKNGRHNLPGAPMLDPAMGVLMVLGIGLALKNIKKPAPLFFLLLFPAALSGGVFSLDFEAPQSLRTIAVLPAVAYFCALPVQALAAEARTAFRPWPARPLWLVAALAGVYILRLNAGMYFGPQAHDFSAWNAFSTPETITGRRMAQLGPGYDFYLSPFLLNHPTVRFLSPDTPHHNTLTLPGALPVRSDATRPVALFIHPDDGRLLAEAKRLYPAGRFETVSDQPSDPPAVHIATLSAADVASVQGLWLNYWAGSAPRPDQVPARALRAAAVDVDWSDALPLAPPFIAEWEGILYAEWYGLYRLQLSAPAEATLELDGREVLSGSGEQSAEVELAQGDHILRLRATSGAGNGRVQLRWQPPGRPQEVVPPPAFYHSPVTNNGLLGRYYPNPNWDGQPALVRNDPFLDTYFHLTPLPRPYSAAWEGMLDAPESGVYVLGLRSVGAARLVLNDRQLLEAVVPNETAQARVTLAAGLHPIRVTFQDTLARSQIHLLWALPGAEQLAPVPAQNLWPPLGSAWRPPARSAPAVPPFETRAMRLVHAATLSEGLVEPRDVAVGPGETAFVADTGVKGVVVFQNFRRVGVWADTADGPFEEPLALVSAPGGSVWVLDSTRQWVYGLTLSGGALGRVGGPEALLYHPRGLALFAAPGAPPTLAIANTGSGQVALFGLDGAPLGTVGMFGEAPGQFNEPVDALRDAFGTYYVTEGANAGRWQRVDSSGRPLAAWPTDAPVALDGSHMAWGPDGSILMTNSQAGSLRRYSPEGELLDEWQAVGPVRFNRPVGIFAAQEQVWVADVGNGEVYVFRVEIE